MSPQQGWFESDKDYRSRVAREADEHTIEDSTGSAPSQGWFENDDSYHERIAREANEHRIEDSTGSAPSQGWFENDDSYHERIAQEANERTIEDSTGSAPSQGWFESAENYDTRIRKEANEQIVEGGTGSSPKQGWFESDHNYRSRIAHEAREIRASEQSNSSTGSNSGSIYSTHTFPHSSSRPSISGVVGSIIVLGIVAVFIYNALSPAPSSQPENVKGATTTPNVSLRSIEGSTSTSVKFVNNSNEVVNIYWKDYQGNEKFYNKLAPGQSYDQQTFVTHPWIVRDQSNKKILLTIVGTIRWYQ